MQLRHRTDYFDTRFPTYDHRTFACRADCGCKRCERGEYSRVRLFSLAGPVFDLARFPGCIPGRLCALIAPARLPTSGPYSHDGYPTGKGNTLPQNRVPTVSGPGGRCRLRLFSQDTWFPHRDLRAVVRLSCQGTPSESASDTTARVSRPARAPSGVSRLPDASERARVLHAAAPRCVPEALRRGDGLNYSMNGEHYVSELQSKEVGRAIKPQVSEFQGS